MYQYPELEQYLQKLQEYNLFQRKKIEEIEKSIQKIEAELKALKEKPQPVTVEKIEYKFDQLKIETLTGTLNIGITPGGAGQIEEMTVNDQVKEDVHFPIEEKYNEVMAAVKRELEQYLDQDARKIIQSLGSTQSQILNDGYQKLIIDDLKKQLDQRIQYYLTKIKNEHQVTNLTELKNLIINKLQGDIQRALETYLKNLPKKENNE